MAKKQTKAKATKSKKPAPKAAGKIDAFRGKTSDELGTQLAGFKKEQFNLRFQRANGQADNTGRIRTLRRDIARIETLLTEQRRAAAKG